MHGPVQMFMPGGGGRRCAAASHTSGMVPTLDRASDVAHCAQNFGQKAKLTISLSNTRRGRRAIAEDGRRATKGQVTGNRRQGRRVGASESPEDAASKPRDTTRYGRLFWSLVSGGGATKTNTPRGPFWQRPPSTPPPPGWSGLMARVTRRDVYTRPAVAHAQGSLRNQTVRHQHVGWLRQRKGRAQLPLPSCGLSSQQQRVHSWVRWPAITTQCASAIAPVGALHHTAQPIKNQSQTGTARDSSAVRAGAFLALIREHMPCQGKGAQFLRGRISLQDVEPNPMTP